MRFYIRREILTVILATLSALLLCGSAVAQGGGTRPRLVVNVVVGSMRATDMDRYSSNFDIAGFNRLRYEGVLCTRAEYSYRSGECMPNLATFATGSLPQTHGVVGRRWYNYSDQRVVDAIRDESVRALQYSVEKCGASPKNLVVETLAESLRAQIPDSKTLTIAIDAASAVALNGGGGMALWIDENSCEWGSSTAYFKTLPDWVKRVNKAGVVPEVWQLQDRKEYINSVEFGIERGHKPIESSGKSKKESADAQVMEYLCYTPAGNSAALDLAWEAVQKLGLGGDSQTDMLNISLDAARYIVSRYGVESKEVEDMYYRLDRDLGDFIDKVRDQVKFRDVIFVVTAAGGSSDSAVVRSRDGKVSRDDGQRTKLFNTDQFVVILNTFLGSKYGAQKWVLGYENGAIYLDHSLIYESRESVAQMQDDVAEFALQFDGVSHAVTATAMRGGHFTSGYGAYLQRGFYPRRSGDVVINLMPGWIEEIDGVRSLSGSIYRYDRSVPLIIMGAGINSNIVRRRVDIVDVAPTISSLIGIFEPSMSEGVEILEVTDATADITGVLY